MNDFIWQIVLALLPAIHFGIWKKSMWAGNFMFILLMVLFMVFAPSQADAEGFKKPCDIDPNHYNPYHLCKPIPSTPTPPPSQEPSPPPPPTPPPPSIPPPSIPPESFPPQPEPQDPFPRTGSRGTLPIVWPTSCPSVYEFYANVGFADVHETLEEPKVVDIEPETFDIGVDIEKLDLSSLRKQLYEMTIQLNKMEIQLMMLNC